MDLYAVFGNPIGHSKSPFIHSEFAKQTGEALEYTAVQAPLDSFAAEVEVLFNGGGKGINVTVPFKEQAWQWVQQRAERAELAG
ncbi:MAG: shikimate dehydrogenase, partial [Pseudomonadales bacterium]|nr:shikimate dehydrogenase [Pseudomonadales bacterium]